MKTRIAIIITTILLMLVICQSTSATDYLFLNGKSDYSIVIQDDASVSEHTAAKDFQSVIR